MRSRVDLLSTPGLTPLHFRTDSIRCCASLRFHSFCSVLCCADASQSAHRLSPHDVRVQRAGGRRRAGGDAGRHARADAARPGVRRGRRRRAAPLPLPLHVRARPQTLEECRRRAHTEHTRDATQRGARKPRGTIRVGLPVHQQSSLGVSTAALLSTAAFRLCDQLFPLQYCVFTAPQASHSYSQVTQSNTHTCKPVSCSTIKSNKCSALRIHLLTSMPFPVSSVRKIQLISDCQSH